ncbi:MAG: PepSY-like domain-containing protein [Lewinella sp.]|jgi:hypothetical protein|uniref:PepSY-like domain-containing protein n=1 Tax=Lewinella sp. TaxID=2004506 RepID=UPI003D6C691E
MKSITLMLACIALLSFACTKKSLEVPQEVTAAFLQKYPSAQSIEWEMENGDYEAEFKLGGQEMSANFTQTGRWLESETAINTSDLPEAVLASIATNFPDAKIDEAEKLDLPDSSVSYEVKLEGDQEMEAVFSASGELIKKTVEDEDHDGDNDDD